MMRLLSVTVLEGEPDGLATVTLQAANAEGAIHEYSYTGNYTDMVRVHSSGHLRVELSVLPQNWNSGV